MSPIRPIAQAATAALALCAFGGLSCAALPTDEARPDPLLEGGPVSEPVARRLAEGAAAGLGRRPPEVEKAFIERGVALLAHRDEPNRAAAAADLGELGRKAAAGLLIRALSDPMPAVRSAAAAALGNVGDSSAAGPLAERLRDISPMVRSSAAGALGQIAGRSAADNVVATQPAAGTLSPSAAAQAETMIGLLKGPDASGRREAAKALGFLRDANAVDPLGRAATGDTDPLTRAAAAASLGRIAAMGRVAAAGARPDANACISHLVKSLSDDASLVRHAAAGALGAIGDRRAVPSLVARLKDDHPAVRAAAAFALGRIADPASAAALADSARTDPDESVRDLAKEALRGLQSAQTTPTK